MAFVLVLKFRYPTPVFALLYVIVIIFEEPADDARKPIPQWLVTLSNIKFGVEVLLLSQRRFKSLPLYVN